MGPQPCSETNPNPKVSSFCFGELSGEARIAFEAHLLECDFCWLEVSRLDAAIAILRGQRQRPKLPMVPVLYVPHVALAAALLASAYAVALLLEVAYEYDRFSSTAPVSALAVWIWIASTTVLALGIDCRWTQRGHSAGLLLSGAVLVASAALLFGGAALYLPNTPITQARFQTYTARAAYLKSIGYFLPLTLIFLAAPYNAILRLGHELGAGNRNALKQFQRSGTAGLRWLVYIPPAALGVVLVFCFCASLQMTTYLFDALLPGPWLGMFQMLAQIRRFLFFALGVECLCWYYWNLNELRSCIWSESKEESPKAAVRSR